MVILSICTLQLASGENSLRYHIRIYFFLSLPFLCCPGITTGHCGKEKNKRFSFYLSTDVPNIVSSSSFLPTDMSSDYSTLTPQRLKPHFSFAYFVDLCSFLFFNFIHEQGAFGQRTSRSFRFEGLCRAGCQLLVVPIFLICLDDEYQEREEWTPFYHLSVMQGLAAPRTRACDEGATNNGVALTCHPSGREWRHEEQTVAPRPGARQTRKGQPHKCTPLLKAVYLLTHRESLTYLYRICLSLRTLRLLSSSPS